MSLLISAFVKNNVEEFTKLDHARSILVYNIDQFLNFFYGVHKPESYQRAFNLIDADRPSTIVIQGVEHLLELQDLAVEIRKKSVREYRTKV